MRFRTISSLCAATFLLGLNCSAELIVDSAPSQDIHLTEESWNQNWNIDSLGKEALAMSPSKWKHAETEHFILHYRRVTEAQKVAREVEYNLWFVANTLGATNEKYAMKSHVFIFQDEKEWKQFLTDTSAPIWMGSFAHNYDLFLHIGGMGEGFDSQTLAHETTHAVVARLYPGKVWPVWLNEGFAEYEGGASVAARKKQWIKGLERELSHSTLDLNELAKIESYPKDEKRVHQLYETSEKLVRYLMTDFPKERFPKFIDAVLAGKSLEQALLGVYGDKVASFDAFEKGYTQFKK